MCTLVPKRDVGLVPTPQPADTPELLLCKIPEGGEQKHLVMLAIVPRHVRHVRWRRGVCMSMSVCVIRWKENHYQGN